jgi:hypothetical protein
MTRNEDNVGFLGTGSGVMNFQLSLGSCLVHISRRRFPELRLTKPIRSRPKKDSESKFVHRSYQLTIHENRSSGKSHFIMTIPQVFTQLTSEYLYAKADVIGKDATGLKEVATSIPALAFQEFLTPLFLDFNRKRAAGMHPQPELVTPPKIQA